MGRTCSSTLLHNRDWALTRGNVFLAAVLMGVLLAAGLPTAAGAATVAGRSATDEDAEPIGTFTFRAGPGENNRLQVLDRGRWMIVVDANRLYAREKCRQVNAHRVRCPSRDVAFGSVTLADGDDRMRFTAVIGDTLKVAGGRGDDVLRGTWSWADVLDGGPGDDRLYGGRGRDFLTGGPGRDQLFGGPADDELVDGEKDAEAAADTFDGGRSDCVGWGDTLDYSHRTAPVHLTLGASTSTEDVLRGIDSVKGGSGDDRLTGDDCGNGLNGGPGDDVIHGNGRRDTVFGGTGNDHVYGDDGDDFVSGNPGRDMLFGGDGDDRLFGDDDGRTVRRETPDTVSCGNGIDGASGDKNDEFDHDCESVPVFGAAPSGKQLTGTAPPTALVFEFPSEPFGTFREAAPD